MNYSNYGGLLAAYGFFTGKACMKLHSIISNKDCSHVLTGLHWTSLWPTVLTGLGVATIHSALPTHWLPFVTASRLNNWSHRKTLTITALAGTGHVLFTALLGALIVWFGVEIDHRIGGVFHLIAATILFAIGAYYIFSYFRRKSHSHHSCCGTKSDRMTIVGLLMVLTFSPCEAFLPVYLSAIDYGRFGFLVLSLALATGTAAGMVSLTWVTLNGFNVLKSEGLEKYESLVLGILLWILGFATAVFE